SGFSDAIEGGEELLVQGKDVPPESPAKLLLFAQPLALLARVAQLRKAVGQLEAPGVQLESLGDTRVGWLEPGQRRLRCGVLGEVGGPVDAERRLDPLQEHPGEEVVPRGIERGAHSAG